jgi:hypothetical protein
MKKLGLFVMALAAIAVLGTSAYAAKTSSKAKLMKAKGIITAVDATAGTISLQEADSTTATTFKVTEKLVKALKVNEKVTVSYKVLANGDNKVVSVQPAKIRAKAKNTTAPVK